MHSLSYTCEEESRLPPKQAANRELHRSSGIHGRIIPNQANRRRQSRVPCLSAVHPVTVLAAALDYHMQLG